MTTPTDSPEWGAQPKGERGRFGFRDPVSRFWEKVQYPDTPDGCMVWRGTRTKRGYGMFVLNRGGVRDVKAHRFAYQYCVGPIPPGLVLDHLCRNPACVNPDHLEPVTTQENIRRGESPPAVNARRTHCPAGHAYAGDNLVFEGSGRKCRTCHNARVRARKARLREASRV